MEQFHVACSFHAVLSRPQALAALLCGEAAGHHSDAGLCPRPLHPPQLPTTSTATSYAIGLIPVPSHFQMIKD